MGKESANAREDHTGSGPDCNKVRVSACAEAIKDGVNTRANQGGSGTGIVYSDAAETGPHSLPLSVFFSLFFFFASASVLMPYISGRGSLPIGDERINSKHVYRETVNRGASF